MSIHQQVMDKILSHFAGVDFLDEVRQAKGEFFDNAGILEEESPAFELRMNQFFDWYFFTRKLSGYSQTPLHSCYTVRELRFVDEEKRAIDDLLAHKHSLFSFIKVQGEDLLIKNLFTNEKMTIKNSPWTVGFNQDEIFEVRLIPALDNWNFTKGFCFHPNSANKYIHFEIKRHLKDPDLDPEDLMLRLVKMRYAFERYRHLKPDAIYAANSKVLG